MDRFVVRENLQPQTVSQQAGRKSAKTGTRRYLTEWKRQFTWVHYHALKERVFCEICSKASESNVVSALSSADQLTHSSYVVDGFRQWGKAVERFRSQGINVVAACSAGKLKQIKDARTALLILSSVQFLCMQGLAVHGHIDADSNLTQLLKLRSKVLLFIVNVQWKHETCLRPLVKSMQTHLYRHSLSSLIDWVVS